MTTVVVRNISTIDLNKVKCKLQCAYATAGYKLAKQRMLGLPCDDAYSCLLKELFFYTYVLSDWEQNDNGTTTGYINRITQEEFTNIINRIKSITC